MRFYLRDVHPHHIRCLVMQSPWRCTFIVAWPHIHLFQPSRSAGAAGLMYLTPAKPRQPPRIAWSWTFVHECAVTLSHALDNFYPDYLWISPTSYLTFCKLHNFPLDPLLDMLSFYIVFMCHHIKPNSV